MQMNTYLQFNGNCQDAFRFYERCLGGRIEAMMTYRGTPMEEHTPAGWRDKIIHACLAVGDRRLMASDSPPDRYQAPQGFHVSLHPTDPAEAERLFAALGEGGIIQMPLEQTFWAARFGMLVDRFGTPWMVNCDRPCG
jgi:PhnB protein